MTKTIAYLQPGSGEKKYKVTIVKPNGTTKTVQFGAKGYSDFTKHKDVERKNRYDMRHKSRENWTKSGITTAGFWSKWILWNKPSLQSSISNTSKRFNITIKRGKPKKSPKRKSRSPKRKSRSPKRKSRSPKRK